MTGTNPVHEWLERVAAECGSPAAMLMWAGHVNNENSKKLIVDYAAKWSQRLRIQAACRGTA